MRNQQVIKSILLSALLIVCDAYDPKPEDGVASCPSGWFLSSREATAENSYVKHWCLTVYIRTFALKPNEGAKLCRDNGAYLSAPSSYSDIEKALDLGRSQLLNNRKHFRRSVIVDGTRKCKNGNCNTISPDYWQTSGTDIAKLYDYGEPNAYTTISHRKTYREDCLILNLLNGRINDFFCDAYFIPGTSLGSNEILESYGAVCGKYAKVEW